MPTYAKKNYKRKRFMLKSKKKIYKRKSLYSRPLGGLPYRGTYKLRYAQEFTLNPAAGGTAVQVFRANSIFDPDFTGVGHQPNGFDQLMLWYNHFTVIDSTITVKFVSATSGNLVPGYNGIWITDATPIVGAQANIEDILESRFSDRKVLSSGTERNYIGQKTYNRKRFNANRFWGTKFIVGKDPYRGTPVSNPTESAYFECWAASIAGNDPGALTFLAIIDYIAVLTAPEELPQS